jgi:antirestriction protein ArdC
MPRTKGTRSKKRSSRKPKVDVYEAVTNAIVEALESGDVGSWTKPWTTGGLHRSASTGREYRGVNQLVTMFSAFAQGFTSNLWLTFNQASKLVGEGEKVLKGERGEQKGTKVVFWKFGDKEVKDANGKPVRNSDGTVRTERVLLFASHYTVFNVEQTNVPVEKYAKHLPATNDVEANEACEAFVAGTGATFVPGGDRAFYSPMADHIGLPPRERFDDAASYYATAFHELTHWTGHESRCDRKLDNRFGDDAYAAEELVAELGSAFLSAEHGLEGKLQHPEYLSHWLKVLKADNKAIFTAASKAQEAADYLKKTVAATATDAETKEAA